MGAPGAVLAAILLVVFAVVVWHFWGDLSAMWHSITRWIP